MNWLTWIQYIPQIIELINAVKKRIDEVETDVKVKDDLKSITKAFNEKNVDHLNHVFNGVPDVTTEAIGQKS